MHVLGNEKRSEVWERSHQSYSINYCDMAIQLANMKRKQIQKGQQIVCRMLQVEKERRAKKNAENKEAHLPKWKERAFGP